MTEKHYGGSSKFGFSGSSDFGTTDKIGNSLKPVELKESNRGINSEMGEFKPEEIEKIKKAGKIAQEVKKYAREIIKPGVKLIDIAYKIDDKIIELGGKFGFPVNLSIDNLAAHFTPNFNCEETARGLLKIDVGVSVDGYIADTAFSMDLEDSEENRKLIEASESAVLASIETFGLGVELGEIGKKIQEAIEEEGAVSIRNLSGHNIERYNIHAGWTIPNYDSGQTDELEPGLYATEPFATNGHGKVKDGAGSGIYKVDKTVGVRDSFSREVLNYVIEEYKGLPFCHRWIHKKFGTRGMLALRMLEQSGVLYQYPQLMEVGKGKVAQTEHNVLLLENGEKIVTTLED
jgi:methionyl aminopeptidase